MEYQCSIPRRRAAAGRGAAATPSGRRLLPPTMRARVRNAIRRCDGVRRLAPATAVGVGGRRSCRCGSAGQRGSRPHWAAPRRRFPTDARNSAGSRLAHTGRGVCGPVVAFAPKFMRTGCLLTADAPVVPAYPSWSSPLPVCRGRCGTWVVWMGWRSVRTAGCSPPLAVTALFDCGIRVLAKPPTCPSRSPLPSGHAGRPSPWWRAAERQCVPPGKHQPDDGAPSARSRSARSARPGDARGNQR